MIETGEIIFAANGKRLIKKTYLANQKGLAPSSLWADIDDTGHNRQAKYELKKIFPETNTSELFSTPKPEKLIKKILHICTFPGDIVLDSFLGSGTTAAVAHKMGRRYIGIEMGEHAKTHCAVRLQKVIDGEQGGISKKVNWKGGGGYRFYKLGEPIFDEQGQINPNIRFKYLATHIWFSETRLPFKQKNKSPLLGIHNGTAYYLLYNGILGDKSSNGGNVLTSKILDNIPKHDGKKIIYGETCRINPSRLKQYQIMFKQTPYDIKAR